MNERMGSTRGLHDSDSQCRVSMVVSRCSSKLCLWDCSIHRLLRTAALHEVAI